MKINKLLLIAIKASIDAGNKIMEIYSGEIEVFHKNDLSPLTKADRVSNEEIMAHISKSSIPIISEENKQLDYEKRKHWDKCWLVDPLDGTKEFINRNGEFTVNIALVEKGLPILGVIYVPSTRELYYADVKKKYACKNIVSKNANKMNLSDSHFLKISEISEDLIRVVGSRSHMNNDTLEFINSIKKSLKKDITMVTVGSSLKFCKVAEGKADIYPRFAPTMEWDTAAGQAICNALGFEVLNSETNEPLKYNKEDLLNPGFIVSRKIR